MSREQSIPTIRFNRILYVTDLSENSRYAFPFAASVAKTYGSSLTVFHVVETERFEKYLAGYISEQMWEEIKTRNLEEARKLLIDRKRQNARIKKKVDEICQETLGAQPDSDYVAYDVVVKLGDPAEEIIAQAEKKNYDLIVIGNYGHRPIRDALMGSTTWRVLHHCRTPVMIIPLPHT